MPICGSSGGAAGNDSEKVVGKTPATLPQTARLVVAPCSRWLSSDFCFQQCSVEIFRKQRDREIDIAKLRTVNRSLFDQIVPNARAGTGRTSENGGNIPDTIRGRRQLAHCLNVFDLCCGQAIETNNAVDHGLNGRSIGLPDVRKRDGRRLRFLPGIESQGLDEERIPACNFGDLVQGFRFDGDAPLFNRNANGLIDGVVRQRADPFPVKQSLGIGFCFAGKFGDLRQPRADQNDRKSPLGQFVHGHNQCAQLVFGQTLNLVYQKNPNLGLFLGRFADELEHVGQVELQIAAVGDTGFQSRFDRNFNTTEGDFEGLSEISERSETLGNDVFGQLGF